jgi:hypothetical protein
MPNLKTSDEAAAASVALVDIFRGVKNGANVKFTFAQVLQFVIDNFPAVAEALQYRNEAEGFRDESSATALEAQANAQSAAEDYARTVIAIAGIASLNPAYRKCCYPTPAYQNVAIFRADTSPTGDTRLTSIVYEDGSEIDLTATARGISPEWQAPRPGIYPTPHETGIRDVIVGNDGNVYAYIYEDDTTKLLGGERNPIAVPDTTAFAYLAAGVLKVIGAQRTRTLVASGAIQSEPVATRPGQIRSVVSAAPSGVRSSLVDVGQFVASAHAFPKTMPAVNGVLYHIITLGQSLSAGSGGAPSGANTVFDYYASEHEATTYIFTNSTSDIIDVRCGKFRGGDASAERIREADLEGIVAYAANGGAGSVHGMTPVDTLGVDWCSQGRETFGIAPKYLITSVGLGGAPFAYWKRTPPANITPVGGIDLGDSWTLRSEFDAVVNAGMAIAADLGLGYKVLAICLKGGESDYTNASSYADAAQVIDEINADLTTPASSCYTGQTEYPIWYGSQPSSFASDNAASVSYNGTESVAAYEALHDAGKLILTGSDYAVIPYDGYDKPSPDFIHLAAQGYGVRGETDREFVGAALAGHAVAPLRFSAVRSGTTITLTYTGGNGSPLVFDTADITERSGTEKGFRWLVGGVSQSISAAITDDREIEITIPSGVSGVLEYAGYGFVTDFIEDEQPRGNVKESVGFASSLPGIATLYHRPIFQSKAVA